MSPHLDVAPGAKTGPMWSPCPLRYLLPTSSTLDVLMVFTV